MRDSNAKPLVLIGIPSHRRPDGLRDLLASLEAQELAHSYAIEVFVADNDPSGMDALAVCTELSSNFRWPLSARVVPEPGISAARNAILEEGRAKDATFIAMLDDDEKADDKWLDEMLRVQAKFDADLVGGPSIQLYDDNEARGLRNSGIFSNPDYQEGFVPKLEATNNILISTEFLSKGGWPQFDSAFGLSGGEDTEYFTRLRKLGASFAWSPDALVTEDVHPDRLKTEWVVKRAFRAGNCIMRILLLHGKPREIMSSSAKALMVLVLSPAFLVLLAFPRWRLWPMVKFARSVGKFSALMGVSYREYAVQRKKQFERR